MGDKDLLYRRRSDRREGGEEGCRRSLKVLYVETSGTGVEFRGSHRGRDPVSGSGDGSSVPGSPRLEGESGQWVGDGEGPEQVRQGTGLYGKGGKKRTTRGCVRTPESYPRRKRSYGRT